MKLISGDGGIEFPENGKYRKVERRTEFECDDKIGAHLVKIGSAFPVEEKPAKDTPAKAKGGKASE